MVQFLIMYALMLLVSAICINGFFTITRGRWEVKPDGTKYWQGKIFSGWSRFLQTHIVVQEFYSGVEWYKEMGKLMGFFKDEDIIKILDTGVIIKGMDAKRWEYFQCFAAVNGIKFTQRGYGPANGSIISTYQEVKRYTLPLWVRAPLGDCIACMASVFGTACWIFWYSLAGTALHDMPTLGIWGLWASFCVSLAYLNELLFSITSKLQR